MSLSAPLRKAMAALHFSNIASLVRDHPVASCALLVFFIPPLFPILLYFSPLLICTALCVLALVSVGPHITAIGEEVERQSKGGRLDDVDPYFRNVGSSTEKMAKQGKPSGYEMAWLDWMEGLNPSGRAWVEKRLKEEDLLSKPPNREVILALIDAEKEANLKACEAEVAAAAMAVDEAEMEEVVKEEPNAIGKGEKGSHMAMLHKIAELEEVLHGGEAICPCILELENERILEDANTDPTNPFSDSCHVNAMEEPALHKIPVPL